MINAGSLREFVTITRETSEELPDGSHTPAVWIPILTTYCRLEQKNASIDVLAAQDNLSQVMVFQMRYRTDIPFIIGDRLSWRDRDLKIHSFSWDIMRTVLTIICVTHNETTDSGEPGS